jgi:hypothetical protein
MTPGFFGKLGGTLRARDADALRAELLQLDFSVPRRTAGRQALHRERYSVARYLETLSESDRLGYPLAVTKRESPDFLLHFAGKDIGLEHTDAGDKTTQAAATKLEKAPRGSFVEAGIQEVRRPGEPYRAKPFVGDEPERLWTNDMREAVEKKTGDLQGYDFAPDCDLLIYDNSAYAVLTAWTVDELPGRLAQALRGVRKESGRRFRRISVLRERVLLFDVEGEAAILRVPGSPPKAQLRLDVDQRDLDLFCRRHQIHKLAFFGSVLSHDRFGPQSDVDVLVEFEPDARVGLLRLAGIQDELSSLIGRTVDMRTVPELSRYFREEVVRSKSEVAYVAG